MERVTPLIAAEGLAVGHGTRSLVTDIAFSHGAGRVLCLLGPNGVGKTTLFRSLLGLIPPLSGRVLLSGRPLAELSVREIAGHLAYVPQSLVSPFAYTALDIVLMGAASRLGPFARPGPAQIRAAMAALDQLGIADLAPRDVTRLSGGQRQLVALAQAAQVMMMDEPTASLDLANRRRVEQAIPDLTHAGAAVVLSSHDPNQAAALADEVMLMGPGGILAPGPAAEVLSTCRLSSLYRLELRQVRREGGITMFY